jgi:hypothetical protein
MAPSWDESAELDEKVYVFAHPDVDDAAYFEFGVRGGGRIMVATGAHDTPFPTFSDLGSTIAEKLIVDASFRGQAVTKLYRLNPRDTLAIDAQQQVVAHSAGALVDTKRTLADYVSALERARVSQGAAQDKSLPSSSYAAEWAALEGPRNKDNNPLFGTDANLTVTDVKWIYHADLLRSFIRWTQHDADPTPEGTCWVGCGPVAWGQIAAYLAYSERWGNPKYQGGGYGSLFPNVSTDKGSPVVRQLIDELHRELGSFCWPYFELSAVWPWHMEDFLGWARGRGADVRLESTWGSPWGGDGEGAWSAIRNGDPVILGWDYNHYNIGVGAGMLNGTRYVWVNNGQGDGYLDGWLRFGDTFYTGIIRPYVSGT